MAIGLVILLTISFALSVHSQTGSYNEDIAADLSLFSQVAYQLEINSGKCKYCNKLPGIVNVIGIRNDANTYQAVVCFYPKFDAIVVSLRASPQIQKWFTTGITTDWVLFPACLGCRVNKKMYNDFNLEQNRLYIQISVLRRLYPNSKLFLTGHSLGGAYAQLFSAYLKSIGQLSNVLYTFGQPRVGNLYFEVFSAASSFSYFRIINNRDPVPHAPLTDDYFPGSQEIWYNPAGMKRYSECFPQSDICSNSVKPRYIFSDHMLRQYMQIFLNKAPEVIPRTPGVIPRFPIYVKYQDIVKNDVVYSLPAYSE